MSGKTPTAILLVELLADLCRHWRSAMSDSASPGMVDRDEAPTIGALLPEAHRLAGVVNYQQMAGYGITRYGEPARDLVYDARDLGIRSAAD